VVAQVTRISRGQKEEVLKYDVGLRLETGDLTRPREAGEKRREDVLTKMGRGEASSWRLDGRPRSMCEDK
jgi:hypothetical protein